MKNDAEHVSREKKREKSGSSIWMEGELYIYLNNSEGFFYIARTHTHTHRADSIRRIYEARLAGGKRPYDDE